MPDTRILLIGESPSKSGTPADQALAGRIGKRLAQLLGTTEAIYLDAFARINLLPDFIGKRPGESSAPWPEQEASIAADQLRASGMLSSRKLVILFGKRVAKAFGFAATTPWFEVQRLKLGAEDGNDVNVVIAPHPSGANRWWNDKKNQQQAAKWWKALRKQADIPEKDTTQRARLRKSTQQEPVGTIPEPAEVGDGIDIGNLPEGVKSAFEPLLPIERRFVVAYCGPARGNAQLAGKMAGVDVMQARDKDKERTAQQIAQYVYTWTHAPKMRKAIDAWMEAHAIGAIELTHMLADAARANAGVFLERGKDGKVRLKPPSDFVWEAHKHWIKSSETDKAGVVTRLEVIDPMQARREIAKILKLYSDQPILALTLTLQSLPDAELLSTLQALKAGQQAALKAADTSVVSRPVEEAELVASDDPDTLEYDPEPEETDE